MSEIGKSITQGLNEAVIIAPYVARIAELEQRERVLERASSLSAQGLAAVHIRNEERLFKRIVELERQLGKLEEYGGPDEACAELERIHQELFPEQEGEDSLSTLVLGLVNRLERQLAEESKRADDNWIALDRIRTKYSDEVNAHKEAKRQLAETHERVNSATEFLVSGSPTDPRAIYIRKCFGSRLPKEPMWKVMRGGQGGPVLAKDGEWELEPIPSSRYDEFYARCRFDTYEEALQAAQAARKERA